MVSRTCPFTMRGPSNFLETVQVTSLYWSLHPHTLFFHNVIGLLEPPLPEETQQITKKFMLDFWFLSFLDLVDGFEDWLLQHSSIFYFLFFLDSVTKIRIIIRIWRGFNIFHLPLLPLSIYRTYLFICVIFFSILAL